MIGTGKTIIFTINLVQDVNVVRGLVYLAARETDAQIGILVSQSFLKRDRQRIWQREVAAMAARTGATVHLFDFRERSLCRSRRRRWRHLCCERIVFFCSSRDLRNLCGRAGKLFTNHVADGFERIGFIQSREHVISHGRNISFFADVVCSWFGPDSPTSLTASQRAKLYVTGPATLLQRPSLTADQSPAAGGLVCENFYSVRLRASGDHKTSFMNIFFDFCAEMAKRQETVTLRPHPGGQYVLKNNVALPSNVRVNVQPTSQINMANYRFGISAPSTIIFDMILAGVPVGLWRDPAGIMDASNFEGLTEISTLDDWLGFRARCPSSSDNDHRPPDRLPTAT